jgi:UDP-N-acetylglucosamine 2-epimerase
MGNVAVEACDAKHVRIEEDLKRHDDSIKDHGGRIHKLELHDARTDEQMSNLCLSINSLVATQKDTNKLFIGALITLAIGLATYIITH